MVGSYSRFMGITGQRQIAAPPSPAMNSPPPHSITSSASAAARWYLEAQLFRGLEVNDEFEFCRCCTGRSAGLAPFNNWSTYTAALSRELNEVETV